MLQHFLFNRIRYFNKHIVNPLLGRLARSKWGHFAIVRHIGRRSGKAYETPIIVQPIDGGFAIALTYGPDVDWYRNVQAAGGCDIVWHQHAYHIDHIEPLDTPTGLTLFPQPERFILRLLHRQHFVRMRRAR
jgi:hypothetical protein